MIKSSKHTIKFSNNIKLENLNFILKEYRRCLQHFIDYLWITPYSWTDDKNIIHMMDIKNNKYDAPQFVTSNIISNSGLITNLSGRLLKCCMTQAMGMIKASLEKQRKRIYIFNKHKLSGKSKKSLKLLIRKIKQNIPQKPNGYIANMELNSICADFMFTPESNDFNGFLQFKCLTTNKIKIKIPVKFDRHSIGLMNRGKMLNSFLVKNNSIDIRWEIDIPKLRDEGNIIGCDQGLKTVLTCSNGITTLLTDNHGHSLDSILNTVLKKTRGSNAFKRAKDHQENFVNWSINHLNLDNIKQINLEEIRNIGYKNRTSKKLSHWQNTLIRDKIESVCEDRGIRLIYQSSTYRSQRCSCCGNVRKSNRKGKIYSCKHCGNTMDADLNAAKNHEISLPEIPYDLRNLNLNRKDGFMWREDGFYDLDGRSLQSLLHKKE